MADGIDDIVDWQMSIDRVDETLAARRAVSRCPNCHREWHGIAKTGCGGSHLDKAVAEAAGLQTMDVMDDTPDMLARLFGL